MIVVLNFQEKGAHNKDSEPHVRSTEPQSQTQPANAPRPKRNREHFATIRTASVVIASTVLFWIRETLQSRLSILSYPIYPDYIMYWCVLCPHPSSGVGCTRITDCLTSNVAHPTGSTIFRTLVHD